MSEIRPIPGLDGYFINKEAAVFSYRKPHLGYVEILPEMGRDCRLMVRWRYPKSRKRKGMFLSRAVLLAFRPNKNSDNLQADHIDGDRHNNNLANLRWVTPKENMANAIRLGCDVRGERHGKAKFTAAQVEAIRRNKFVTVKQFAAIFKVSESAIRYILRRRTWNGNIYKRPS